MLSAIFTQSDIPLDHNEGPERAGVQRRPREGYSHGTSERDQVRHRGIPYALHAAVQVARQWEPRENNAAGMVGVAD